MLLNIKKLSLLIFSLFFMINIASSGGHFDASDGIEYFLVTESMALNHSAKLYPDAPSVHQLHFDISNTINTNSYFQGIPYLHSKLTPIYIEHCCLLSAIAVPFYYAAIFFSVSPIALVAILVNSIILTLISVVIFRFSLEIKK
jgi:hypothetical protein